MLPAHWTEDDLAVKNARLHYLRTGNGGKPPLVLVHGFSDNVRCWLQTALDLEDSYDIIMPDARGHGLSSRVQPGEPLDMVADLAGIIQSLELHRPIVAGHSMGAMTAFQLGVRYPEIPRALILEDPPWSEGEQDKEGGQPPQRPLSELIDRVSRTTLEDFMAESRLEHPAWPDWVINTWCPAKKQLDPEILTVLTINRTDWQEGIPQLKCPTLIFTADPEKGGIVTPPVAARVQDLNDRCRVVHMPGTGHHIRFEDYDTYMGHVRAFLQGLD